MNARDRDAEGRARSARPRDGLGRPLPYGEPGVERQPEGVVRTHAETVAEAQRLLDAGMPFHAHEVFEDAWKSGPQAEAPLWRALAQLAVGLTHAARGNAVGGARLLRRGADALALAGRNTAGADAARTDAADKTGADAAGTDAADGAWAADGPDSADKTGADAAGPGVAAGARGAAGHGGGEPAGAGGPQASYGLDVAGLVLWARELAGRVEAGAAVDAAAEAPRLTTLPVRPDRPDGPDGPGRPDSA